MDGTSRRAAACASARHRGGAGHPLTRPRPMRERGATKPLPLGGPGLIQVLCGAAGGLIAGEALGRSARPSTWPGAWLGDGQPWLAPTWSSGRGAANLSRLLLCCLPALPPRSRCGAEFAEGRLIESINVGVYLAAGLALAWWCECTVCKHGVKASSRSSRMGRWHGPWPPGVVVEVGCARERCDPSGRLASRFHWWPSS